MIECEVKVGQAQVSIRRKGRSDAVVANILGTEPAEDGQVRLYLDRLVHGPGEDRLGNWHCSGAVSTILEGVVGNPC